MRTLWFSAVLACAVVAIAPAARADSTLATFFPSRPTHAGIKWAKGVLTAYERGTNFGGFNLRDDATGQIARFALARRISIAGRDVVCSDPPQPGYDHFQPGPSCPDWPTKIVIGSTHVIVTYWKTIDPEGRETNVADTIARGAAR